MPSRSMMILLVVAMLLALTFTTIGARATPLTPTGSGSPYTCTTYNMTTSSPPGEPSFTQNEVFSVAPNMAETLSNEIAIGFPFAFYGVSVSSLVVSSYGYILFDAGVSPAPLALAALPFNSAPASSFLAFFAMETKIVATGSVVYGVAGPDGMRTFVLKFMDVASPYDANAGYTISVMLTEADNSTEVRFYTVGQYEVSSPLLVGMGAGATSYDVLVNYVSITSSVYSALDQSGLVCTEPSNLSSSSSSSSVDVPVVVVASSSVEVPVVASSSVEVPVAASSSVDVPVAASSSVEVPAVASSSVEVPAVASSSMAAPVVVPSSSVDVPAVASSSVAAAVAAASSSVDAPVVAASSSVDASVVAASSSAAAVASSVAAVASSAAAVSSSAAAIVSSSAAAVVSSSAAAVVSSSAAAAVSSSAAAAVSSSAAAAVSSSAAAAVSSSAAAAVSSSAAPRSAEEQLNCTTKNTPVGTATVMIGFGRSAAEQVAIGLPVDTLFRGIAAVTTYPKEFIYCGDYQPLHALVNDPVNSEAAISEFASQADTYYAMSILLVPTSASSDDLNAAAAAALRLSTLVKNTSSVFYTNPDIVAATTINSTSTLAPASVQAAANQKVLKTCADGTTVEVSQTCADASSSSNSSLSGGAIAGIVIGSVFAVLLLLFAVTRFRNKSAAAVSPSVTKRIVGVEMA